MNIIVAVWMRAEFILRSLTFYYPPLRRFSLHDLPSGSVTVGKAIDVEHANSKDAEWYAIRGRFMRLNLWELVEADAYVVVGQKKEGYTVTTTVQPYRIG
jgi:hypothetical protein